MLYLGIATVVGTLLYASVLAVLFWPRRGSVNAVSNGE